MDTFVSLSLEFYNFWGVIFGVCNSFTCRHHGRLRGRVCDNVAPVSGIKRCCGCYVFEFIEVTHLLWFAFIHLPQIFTMFCGLLLFMDCIDCFKKLWSHPSRNYHKTQAQPTNLLIYFRVRPFRTHRASLRGWREQADNADRRLGHVGATDSVRWLGRHWCSEGKRSLKNSLPPMQGRLALSRGAKTFNFVWTKWTPWEVSWMVTLDLWCSFAAAASYC